MKHRIATGMIALLFIASSALAERSGGRSKQPLEDQNWPTGSVELANLPSRIGLQMSDPARTELYYQGDTAALQLAIDKLGAIRWEKVELILRDGPYKLPGGGWSPPGMAGESPDWVFTLYDPPRFNRWMNNPNRLILDNFRTPVPPPQMVVYIGGRAIDWSKITVPRHLDVTDERADAAGFAAGPVLHADIYDLATSKPIPGARLAIGVRGAQNSWTLSKDAVADATGHAELARFEPGQFVVAGFAEGYAPRTAQYVEFRGNTFKQFTIYLSRIGIVTGTVVGDEGEPLKGVTLRPSAVLAPDGSEYRLPAPRSIEATTDEDGRFTLHGLPEGFFYLFLMDSAYVRAGRMEPKAAPAKDLVLSMARSGSVRGKVLDPQGQPRANGNIRIQVPGKERVGTWGGSTQVKSDGTFEFTKIPPGRYILTNSPDPDRIPPGAKEIQIEAGKTVEVELRW